MKELSRKHLAGWTLACTASWELATAISRFGFQLQSTRDTAYLATLTFGLRIHHGYVGVLLLIVAWLLHSSRRPLAQRVLIVGLTLILSDLAHHFLVLWPLTGDPQFDLLYPKN